MKRLNTTRTAIGFLIAFSFIFPSQVNSTSSPLVRVAAVKRKPATPREIIKKWADHYGVDNDLAVRIAHAESSLSCTVQNKESSAGGLFQFTNATFLLTQKRLGKVQDLSKKFDCDENAELAVFLLSKGQLHHWDASRAAWDRDAAEPVTE
jgi:hypothetical protein